MAGMKKASAKNKDKTIKRFEHRQGGRSGKGI